MRNMLIPLSCFPVIIIFFVSSGRQKFRQEKVSLSSGSGIPELINVGIQNRIEQTQIGIGFGFFPPSGSGSDTHGIPNWGTLMSLSGETSVTSLENYQYHHI